MVGNRDTGQETDCDNQADAESRNLVQRHFFLQSLAQLKTLFADGAWEGVAGNCDTSLYLGGNEASTFEYVSKLLGKWTIDKRTSGESKGTSGSYSENYDVFGRELMLESEIRLLSDDECILFVRGENPIRDKK